MQLIFLQAAIEPHKRAEHIAHGQQLERNSSHVATIELGTTLQLTLFHERQRPEVDESKDGERSEQEHERVELGIEIGDVHGGHAEQIDAQPECDLAEIVRMTTQRPEAFVHASSRRARVRLTLACDLFVKLMVADRLE